MYIETQKFTQWWLWVILIVITVRPILEGNIKDLYIFIMFTLMFFIYIIKLTVIVNDIGISYRFFPIHFKAYSIKFNEIKSAKAVKYNPILDYGGWGIRYRFKTKAYNIKGNKGVRIYLKNGKNILFGSQKHKEFSKIINQNLLQSNE